MVSPVKGGLSGDMLISNMPDITDIDADHKDPQLCSVYAPEIYSNLRVAEVCAVDRYLSFCLYNTQFSLLLPPLIIFQTFGSRFYLFWLFSNCLLRRERIEKKYYEIYNMVN